MEVQLPSRIVRPTDALHLFSRTRKHKGITYEKGKGGIKGSHQALSREGSTFLALKKVSRRARKQTSFR